MTHQRNRSVRKRKSMRGGWHKNGCTTCVGGRRRSNRRSMRGGMMKLIQRYYP